MTRLGLSLFFAMNVMAFTLALWSAPETVDDPKQAIFYGIARWICMLLSIPVVFLLSPTLIAETLADIKNCRVSTNVFLLFGALAAWVYSLVSVVFNRGHIYFEVATTVLVATSLGRWLEAQGKQKTTSAIRELERLIPEHTLVFHEGEFVRRLVREINIGDRVRVLAGARIPVDGEVVCGNAFVDEQVVTGESEPSAKKQGERVYSGGLSLDGVLEIKALSAGKDGQIQRMVRTILEATQFCGPIQSLVDQISKWFLPITLLAALLAGTIAIYPTPSSSTMSQRIEAAALAAFATIVVACPCALSLATPMAFWAAIGSAARKRLLFRSGEALERLASVRVIALDKTGTLTEGKPWVERVCQQAPLTQDQVDTIWALANASQHPVSSAAKEYLSSLGPSTLIPDLEIAVTPGIGIGGKTPNGDVYRLASLGGLRSLDVNIPNEIDREAQAHLGPHVAAAMNRELLAVFFCREKIRPEARRMIAALRQNFEEDGRPRLPMIVLSGDQSRYVNHLADELEIEAKSNLTPSQKVECIDQFRRELGPVLMVGDGMNDAPSLAVADVSFAMGCGADLSREAASACLLSSDLSVIPWAIQLAKRAKRVVRWNLFWAVAYNSVAMGCAVLGIVHPIGAAFAMGASSLFVIAGSLSLTFEPTTEGADVDVLKPVDEPIGAGA